MEIFTIGYGGRAKDEFLDLLLRNHIRTVIDVRLRPDRAAMGIYVKAKDATKGIEKVLSDAGIGYRSIVELGNVFMELDDWHERYLRLLESSGALLTERLPTTPGERVCLLCAEKQPGECHRRDIADYLAARRGATVQHLV